MSGDLLSRWENTPGQYEKLEKLVPNFVWQETNADLFELDTEI